MIAVLEWRWLRATMIEARSQGGKAASEKSCCGWCWSCWGFGVGFAGAIVCFVARASPLQAAFQMMRLQRKARSGCQRDAGRSWAVGREEVGDGAGCCGLDGGGAVVVVLSLAREVRWGIRSYSSVRVGGCAPLEIFGASCSGFDSATLHQCGLWPRQHPSGLAQAVGHSSRQCSAARILCRCC